ncbi:MAG TPA: hypothetical protein VM370_08440 [Candidatus Thermoplasmatota archaeon]|nr:hypothetical protein [Candidatus Thermoplasmatota archaeon]
MKAMALVAAMALLAGCTQLDDAKRAAEDAKKELGEAQREAQEAQARYERVKSATVVRNETVRVIVVPMSDPNATWFDAGAWRGDVLIPPENLTALPAVKLAFGGRNVTCDPLTCRLGPMTEDITVTWADGSDGVVLMSGGHNSCDVEEPTSSYCRLHELTRNATIRLTTALGDATD